MTLGWRFYGQGGRAVALHFALPAFGSSLRGVGFRLAACPFTWKGLRAMSHNSETAQLSGSAWREPPMLRAWRTRDFRTVFHLAGQDGLTPEVIADKTGLPLHLVLDVMRGNTVFGSGNSGVIEQVATGLRVPDELRGAFGLVPRAAGAVILSQDGKKQDKKAGSSGRSGNPSGTVPLGSIDVPAEFWDGPETVAALRATDIGALLALLSDSMNASQTQVGMACGMPQGTVSEIIRGTRKVGRLAVLDRIATGLNMPDHTRIILGIAPKNPRMYTETPEDGKTGLTNRPKIIRSGPVGQENQSVALSEEDVERRQLLRVFGGMAAAPLIAGIDRPRRELENSINPVTTGSDADEWERIALQYACEVGRVPPMQVIPELHADLDEAQIRLAGARDSSRIRMMRVCGQLGALMAIAFTNIGEFRIADRYWRTAARASDETNDCELRSLVRGRRAVFALYGEKTPHSSVLALAEDAIEIADGTACAGVASGYAARAQTLALLGRHEESKQAVEKLADVFEHLPGQTVTDPTSQWGWGEARLRHVEGHVYSYAGRFDEATAAQTAALALYPKDGYQGRTQVELYKSICIIRCGDPAEGVRHAMRTVQSLSASCQNDAVVRKTATLILNVIPESAANLSPVLEARDFLALPEGSS